MEKYGIAEEEEVKEVNQVYWDIFDQSVRKESRRLAEPLAQQMAEKLGQEIGE